MAVVNCGVNFRDYRPIFESFLVTFSHTLFISVLGLFRMLLFLRLCAGSFSFRIFPWCSLYIISTSFHWVRWTPFFHTWSPMPDLSVSSHITTLQHSSTLSLRCRDVLPLYSLRKFNGMEYTHFWSYFLL